MKKFYKKYKTPGLNYLKGMISVGAKPVISDTFNLYQKSISIIPELK